MKKVVRVSGKDPLRASRDPTTDWYEYNMMVAVAPLAGKRIKNLIRTLWLIFSILTLLLKLAKHRDSSTPVDESYTSVRCF